MDIAGTEAELNIMERALILYREDRKKRIAETSGDHRMTTWAENTRNAEARRDLDTVRRMIRRLQA